MRLIKWNNYPPYILDTVDRTVLACGMLPLRMLYYRSNEAKIPSMTRMGFQ